MPSSTYELVDTLSAVNQDVKWRNIDQHSTVDASDTRNPGFVTSTVKQDFWEILSTHRFK